MTTLRREIRIPVYWMIVGLMVMIVSPLLSIVVSVKVNNTTIRKSEQARNDARVEALVRYCRLLGSQVDVYSDAESDVGRAAYRTWLTEYNTQGCQPRK